MSYDISQLPLRFNNAKQVRTNNIAAIFIFSFIFLLCAATSIGIIFGHAPGLAAWKVVLGALLPWAVFGALLGFGGRSSDDKSLAVLSAEKGELTIDKQGVRIEIGADVRSYLWNEIWSVQKKLVHAPGQSGVFANVVQIKRKGQIVQDTYDDLIDESFGIKVEELAALLRQGIQRWGGMTQTAGSARPH